MRSGGYAWVEPFAGAAAVALRLVGGPTIKPPVAWMGGKRRFARAIADAMGVPPGRPARVDLCDAGPWGWVWPLLLTPFSAARVELVLRSWVGEHPRELWDRLVDDPPAEDPHERAAQWLWLQARSASGVPIWWDGWRHVDARGRKASDRGEDLRWPGHQAERERWVSTRPQQEGGVRDAKHALDTRRVGWRQEDHDRGRSQAASQAGGSWMASDGRGEPRVAGQKGAGSWEQGSGEGRAPQPAGQRGSWRFGSRPDRVQESRVAGQSGEKWSMQRSTGQTFAATKAKTGGMVNPATIADRIDAIAAVFRRVSWGVQHCDVWAMPALSRASYVYLDPPYQGRTGYGWDCSRERVLELGAFLAEQPAALVVAISEAEPLDLDGWHHVELTAPGAAKPEWLTLSRAPARVPERQEVLFDLS